MKKAELIKKYESRVVSLSGALDKLKEKVSPDQDVVDNAETQIIIYKMFLTDLNNLEE